MAADDFELLAAELRTDLDDLETFVEALARKLEAALPGTTVSRRRRWLSHDGPVERICVELGEEQLVLEHRGGTATAQRARRVRGIVLKSEPLGLDEWVDALTLALAERAESSEEGRLALERLLGLDQRPREVGT
jgi:hypothetical protein